MKKLLLPALLLGGLASASYSAIEQDAELQPAQVAMANSGDDGDDFFARYDKHVAMARKAKHTKDNCKTQAQHQSFTSPDLQFLNLRGHVKEVIDLEGPELDDLYTYFDLNGRLIIVDDYSDNPILGEDYKRDANGYIIGTKYDYGCYYKVVWNSKHQVVKIVGYDDTTTYTYDAKGLLTKEVHTSDNGEKRTLTYRYKTFDSYGNWLKRSVHPAGGDSYQERRKITYYTR